MGKHKSTRSLKKSFEELCFKTQPKIDSFYDELSKISADFAKLRKRIDKLAKHHNISDVIMLVLVICLLVAIAVIAFLIVRYGSV